MHDGLTLGITKIGDLLLRNKISETESGESCENVSLKIPVYQRPYKWTVKNANQLLDDIEEAMNANKEVYRVGTLILHRDGGNYYIVDGQQRTITFSLLLDCLEQSPINFLNEDLSHNSYNLHNVMNNHRAFGRRIENSVASLKFMIMMQLCKDNSKWEFDEVKAHQEKMIAVLMA